MPSLGSRRRDFLPSSLKCSGRRIAYVRIVGRSKEAYSQRDLGYLPNAKRIDSGGLERKIADGPEHFKSLGVVMCTNVGMHVSEN